MTGQQQAGEALEKMMSATLLAVARQLVKGGISPTDSVKLAGGGMIAGALGRQVLLDLGVPLRTIQDWQKRTREALAGTDPEVPPAELINDVLAAMGVPFRVVAE